VTLLLDRETRVESFGEERYGDVDLEWTPGLLTGELRLRSREGFQWLRSGRRCHIFAEAAEEPGMVSVGAATAAGPYAILCSVGDEAAVRAAAAACGSPPLASHGLWTGVPEGWTVLSDYRPTRGAAGSLTGWLSTLDRGAGTVIKLLGGLEVRSKAFAEGRPPTIEVAPLADGAVVTIDGRPAEVAEGGWRAEAWNVPGSHLIDVVPGPSATYEIVADPWSADGWPLWDAHSGRFSANAAAPWARAQICGALVAGPAGEHVLAADATMTVVGLGLRRGLAILRPRRDVPAAVGLLHETPAFLLAASGPRRRQGRVIWLSPAGTSQSRRPIDPEWAAAVRDAAARRLPLDGGGDIAEEAWRSAKERARRWKKPRP
jgi:hypothetical protein